LSFHLHQVYIISPDNVSWSAIPTEGRQKGFDKLHIGLAIPIKDIVVPPLVENVQGFWLWRGGVKHLCMAHVDQLVVPGMEHERLALKTAELGGIVEMALQLIQDGGLGHPKLFRLDPQEKPFGDIGHPAFEN
jgi:hypothetical protein